MAEDGLAVVTGDTHDHLSESEMPTHAQNKRVMTLETLVLPDGNEDAVTAQPSGDGSDGQGDSSLQSLLALPVSRIMKGEAIQIVSLPAGAEFSTLAQVLPTAQIGTVLQQQTVIAGSSPGIQPSSHDGSAHMSVTLDTSAAILMPPPPVPQKPLPPGCPNWASVLQDCECIGDSYRGWVGSEAELESLLNFHKQQTQSFWGTRQSPCPAKPSTRLMWKSQYVPFDGIPFVNSGSRAIVMECQYGPRRKGAQIKRAGDQVMKEFRQTCPARIYIKKVRKFPEYQVDINQEKKPMRLAMDKVFQELKQVDLGATDNIGLGGERFYVQLPTEKAHEFHNDGLLPDECEPPPVMRLHPKVVQKIREQVAGGETRVYAIRKQLRRFVEKEVFDGNDSCAEKHNLTLFPTVNDLQNHVHQALKDIEAGILQCTAPTVNVEVITSDNHVPICLEDLNNPLEQSNWHTAATPAPHAETVTVTLTQNPRDDGGHVISRVETHLSDGTTQVSASLTPETAQLLAKLHPNMFPSGNVIQLPDSSLPVPTCEENKSVVQHVQVQSQTSQGSNVPEMGNQTNTPNNFQLIEADSSDTGALHVVKTAAMDSNALRLMSAGTASATSFQLLQQDGSFQLLQTAAAPFQLIQAGDSNTFQVMQLNQVVQNVQPVVSNAADKSGESGADSRKQLIKQEDGDMSISDNLGSMDMEHESDSLVLHEENGENQFSDTVED